MIPTLLETNLIMSDADYLKRSAVYHAPTKVGQYVKVYKYVNSLDSLSRNERAELLNKVSELIKNYLQSQNKNKVIMLTKLRWEEL